MLSLSEICLLALPLLAVELLYKFLFYPVFISSLRKVPNIHPTASISPIWILWQRWHSHENEKLDAAHRRLGPVVRLGPTEVSINSFDGGIRTVYGSFEKHNWYATIFNNYGIPNMFSTVPSKPHSDRKRLLTNIYSKSFLQSSQDVQVLSEEIIYRRLLPILQAHHNNDKSFDVFEVWNCTAMDFVTAYIFGLPSSTNFLEEREKAAHWLNLYQSRKSPRFVFWPQELPNLTKWVRRAGYRLVPKWIDSANRDIEAWCLDMCDDVLHGLYLETQEDRISPGPGNNAVVLRTLYNGLVKQAQKDGLSETAQLRAQRRVTIASELLDQLAAGHETTAITLTFLVHRLSLHPNLQQILRRELLSLSPSIAPSSASETPLPSFRDLDALPLLNALIYETLRLTPPIPGGEPRITPKGGCFLGPSSDPKGPYFIPGNIRVSASPYALHHESSIFPEADKWRPDRWLDDEIASPKGGSKGSAPSVAEKKERWWWPFSSGGRMCIGSNFAMLEMKMLVATLYTTYKTVLIEGQEEAIRPQDGYMGQPIGNKLFVRLERWDAEEADSAISVRSMRST